MQNFLKIKPQTQRNVSHACPQNILIYSCDPMSKRFDPSTFIEIYIPLLHRNKQNINKYI